MSRNERVLRLYIVGIAIVLLFALYIFYYYNSLSATTERIQLPRVLALSSCSPPAFGTTFAEYDEKYSSERYLVVGKIKHINDLTAPHIVAGDLRNNYLKYVTFDGVHENSTAAVNKTPDNDTQNKSSTVEAQKSTQFTTYDDGAFKAHVSIRDTMIGEHFKVNSVAISCNKTVKLVPMLPGSFTSQQFESIANDKRRNRSPTLMNESNSRDAVSANAAPTVVIPVRREEPFRNIAVSDTVKGITTNQLYESGHLDANPLLCASKSDTIKLLIIITSAQAHQEARLAIRQTWGHYASRRDIAIAFVLGYTTNQTLEAAISEENFIYEDLIRSRFIDSYNNLTLKTISALEWVDKYCPSAHFILKTDDDMFINVVKLMAFIEKHKDDKRAIYGRLAKNWKPIRNKKSKYYVSVDQFSATVFPPFTTGPAYVLTNDIVHDLYVTALKQTYFKLEDVFTTGIVAQKLGIRRIHVNEFLNRRISFTTCNIRKTISVHMIKWNEQYELWKKLFEKSAACN